MLSFYSKITTLETELSDALHITVSMAGRFIFWIVCSCSARHAEFDVFYFSFFSTHFFYCCRTNMSISEPRSWRFASKTTKSTPLLDELTGTVIDFWVQKIKENAVPFVSAINIRLGGCHIHLPGTIIPVILGSDVLKTWSLVLQFSRWSELKIAGMMVHGRWIWALPTGY